MRMYGTYFQTTGIISKYILNILMQGVTVMLMHTKVRWMLIQTSDLYKTETSGLWTTLHIFFFEFSFLSKEIFICKILNNHIFSKKHFYNKYFTKIMVNAFMKTLTLSSIIISSVQFSRSVVFHFLWPHGRQNARALCTSQTPRVYSNS